MSENKRRLLLSKSAYLHEDLGIEIMSRVPVKSLTRFKSVSKRWKSIIEDQTFITLHHKRAHSRPEGGSLLICTPLMPKRNNHTQRLRLFSVPYNGGPAHPLLPNLLSKLKGYKASPSIHGLILLSRNYSRNPYRPVFVFNPTTTQLIPIPPLQIGTDDDHDELCKLAEQDPHICLMSTYSLGFDPSTGVYKLLSIYIAALYRVEKIGCNLYHVFTLGSKDWRKLDSSAYQLIPEDTFAYDSCCANGTIYFKTNHNSISAFDVREEKFCLVTPPPQVTPNYKLMELGGRLALRENKHFEVWILEDGNWICLELEMPSSSEWRDHAIVGDYTIAGGIQSSNKCLLAQQLSVCDRPPYVYYSNKNGQEWSRFQITGLPDSKLRKYGFITSNHVETLFSPHASLQR